MLWPLAGCMLLLHVPGTWSAWGFSAHRWVNEAAIHALPDPLHGFFKSHQAWLVEHAVDADRRKHTVEGEDVKHYIDLDRYGDEMSALRAQFPCSWRIALEEHGEETVRENGIGPWNAVWTYRKLVEAFAALDSARILRYAADLGHYIGDLHVPLHTTENYNGQMTNQTGIHGLWETEIPERQIARYNLAEVAMDAAVDVDMWVWDIVFESHAAVDSVLRFERELTAAWGDRPTHAYVERGRVQQRLRAPDFVDAYALALNGQVERRMQQSVARVAGAWWWAWVEAGEPDLASITARSKQLTKWQRFKHWLLGS